MLSKLKINNYLLIKDLELNFYCGFTVFTGETGSGKSIIIDALMVLFGGKFSLDFISPNEQQAIFEAEFTLDKQILVAWLEDNDLINIGNKQILLCKRVIDKNGKNKVYVNGNFVTISKIKYIGELILDIHSQHSSITLLKQDVQRELLDRYALINKEVSYLGRIYKNICKLEESLKVILVSNHAHEKLKLELQGEFEELSDLMIKDNEWEDLNITHTCLNNAKLILQEFDYINGTLSGEEKSLTSLIGQLVSKVEKISKIYPKCSNIIDLFESINIELQEVSHEIMKLVDSVESDPDKLLLIEERINLILNVSKKYKIRPDFVAKRIEEISRDLQAIESNSDINEIQSELEEQYRQYNEVAQIVTEKRLVAAEELTKKITELLHKLAIQGNFAVKIDPLSKLSSFGMENVEYLVSFNKGLDLQPLSKVISGGELSRTALAIYVLLSTLGFLEVIIFDEIDVGIGGKIAAYVGNMLRKLGGSKQVICITHQPQMASYANHHLVVSKDTIGDGTVVNVREVREHERVEEIARMLSGAEVTNTTIEHAQELLNTL